jgi:hypothetical protein
VSAPARVAIPTFNEDEEDLEATPNGARLRGAARRPGSERLWLQLVLALAAATLLATATSARNVARSRRWETIRGRVSAALPISAAGANVRLGARAQNRTGTHEGLALGSAAPINGHGVARGRVYQRPRIEALACDLYVEAESRDRSVGAVKGFAIAFACREHRRGAETYLLVDDPSKLGAVWVNESEVQLRSVAAQPRGREREP